MRKKILLINVFALLIFILNCSTSLAFNFYPDDLNSDSVYMLNWNRKLPVVEKNINKRRSPASLTKIMTFIITYENSADRDQTKVKVSKEMLESVDPESSGVKLKVGEEVSINDLLKCMMISSSGYAATVLAYHIGGSIEKFVEMMNQKVQELGCNDTHFANPDGIYNQNQYSTALDISKITEYAMQNPEFIDIVGKSECNIFGDERDPVVTTNRMLDEKRGGKYYCPWVRGIKTGYIEDAGRCLVSYAVKDNNTYLAVVMGGPTRDAQGKELEENFAMLDTLNLYNWAFKSLKSTLLYSKNLPLTEINMEFAFGKDKLLLAPSSDVHIVIPQDLNEEEISVNYEIPDSINAPVSKGDKIGKAEVNYRGEKLNSFDLISLETFKRSYLLVISKTFKDIVTSKIFISILLLIVVLAVCYIFILFNSNKSRNKKKKLK